MVSDTGIHTHLTPNPGSPTSGVGYIYTERELQKGKGGLYCLYMSIPLPSKRLIVTSVTILVILVFFFLLDNREAQKNQEANNRTLQESTGTLSAGDTPDITRDSDEDGLEDWEELLWQTNPFNADSNDDGVSDLVEVNTQKQANTRVLEEVGYIAPDIALTNTDRIAQQLYVFANSLPEGEGLSLESAEIVTELISKQVRDLIPEKSATLANINIVSQNELTLTTYLAELYNLLELYALQPDQVQTINSAILNLGTANSINLIDSHYREQQRFVEGLISIPIPEQYANPHLEILNATQRYRDILEAITKNQSDPLAAYSALYQYRSTVENIWNTYKEFDEVITNTQN
ncbi:MAG: hypothetical protein ACI83D_000310 [Planctomycetota bacterium]